jgi:hypothetical protein
MMFMALSKDFWVDEPTLFDIVIGNRHHSSMQFNVNDARDRLPEPRKKRRLGTLKSEIQVLDPNWWKPMTDCEVEDFFAGHDYPAVK